MSLLDKLTFELTDQEHENYQSEITALKSEVDILSEMNQVFIRLREAGCVEYGDETREKIWGLEDKLEALKGKERE